MVLILQKRNVQFCVIEVCNIEVCINWDKFLISSLHFTFWKYQENEIKGLSNVIFINSMMKLAKMVIIWKALQWDFNIQ